jgi:hypothetical protein
MESLYWYKADGDDLHQLVISRIGSLLDQQHSTSDAHLHRLRMYSNRLVVGIYGNEFQLTETEQLMFKYNVVQELIDSLVSWYADQRIALKVTTDAGSWGDRRRAKLAELFLKGQFENNKERAKRRLAFRHACIFSRGYIHYYHNAGEIESECVFPPEIVWDEREAMGTVRRQMYRIREVSREGLLQQTRHKDKIAVLEQSEAWEDTVYLVDPYDANRDTDRITLFEAWYLPSDDYDREAGTGKSGRYVMATTAGVLDDAEWTDMHFPFVEIRIRDGLPGAWGESVVDDIEPLQIWLNELLDKAYRQLGATSVKVMLDAMSTIEEEHLDAEDMTILRYNSANGNPPSTLQVGALSGELLPMIVQLIEWSHTREGTNQLQAMGMKPPGLNSGAALRQYLTASHRRQAEMFECVNESAIETGQRYMELARRITEAGEGSYKIMSVTPRGRRRIDWTEIDLQRDQYTLGMAPSNYFSESPSARLQQAQELVSAGVLPQTAYAQLLEAPDIRAILDLQNAPYDLVQMELEAIEEGERRPIGTVVPEMDLKYAAQVGLQSWCRAVRDGAPDSVCEELLTFVSQARDMLMRAQQPPPQQQPPPMQQGQPGQPPQPPPMPQQPPSA